ncbi:TRAP transporter large permease [Bacteroides sp. OttesenSCG-928-J23]|nr:TRAP transporter large permease [Bacteroides sp. OttesenSCG-928-J23]
MEIYLSAGIILLLMFLGMQVPFSFLAGTVSYIFLTGSGMATVGPAISYAINSPTLLAVPLFMLAGSLMEISGIADRLIDFAGALLKRAKNGLGATIPLASMFFGALCGSGTATVAVLGNIMVPKLEKMGWKRSYTAALLAASGPLGYMIPPNMSAVIYAVVADCSVAALFLATVIPGVIWGVLYIVLNRFLADKWIEPVPVPQAAASGSDGSLQEESYWAGVLKAFRSSIPAFMLPVIIMGGIYGGICTATEAGAVACVYALLIGILFRKINVKSGFGEFVKSGKSLASIFIIFPMVAVVTRFLVINNVPQQITQALTSLSSNRYVILMMINLILFVAGLFFDASIFTLVITPLLLPTAKLIGLDPIQLGVILFVAMGVGTITPPMAMNLFVAGRVCNVKVNDMLRPILPFLFFAAIPILFLVTFVPQLSLWLPNLVMG